MPTEGSKPRANPLSPDHEPTVPPSPAVRKRQGAQVIELQAAVAGTLKHFLLDSTKRKLMDAWLRGVRERELQKIYTDPLFGSPKREEIEEVLLEQVRLLIRNNKAA